MNYLLVLQEQRDARVSCSKQTDVHTHTGCTEELTDAGQWMLKAFLWAARNPGEKNSLGQSNVKILYLVLAALPCSLLKCMAGKAFFRPLSLFVRDQVQSKVGHGPLMVWNLWTDSACLLLARRYERWCMPRGDVAYFTKSFVSVYR